MWFYCRNYRDADKVGTGTVFFKHALLSWYELPRRKQKYWRRKKGITVELEIRGRITAALPVWFLLGSRETAGEEKRSSHMWELVGELSQVQRVSLVDLSQAQSAAERLCSCDSFPEAVRWEEHFGFRWRGRVHGRHRPGEWWVLEDVWSALLSSHTEKSTQLLSCSQLIKSAINCTSSS